MRRENQQPEKRQIALDSCSDYRQILVRIERNYCCEKKKKIDKSQARHIEVAHVLEFTSFLERANLQKTAVSIA